MRNWSTDLKFLAKFPAKYRKFRLESLINFGTDGEKLKRSELAKELPNLDIDPHKKKYLKLLIS